MQLKTYANQHGVDLRQSYFYTDSIADLPLLEIVGYPVAVNPDRPLRKLAKAAGLVDRALLLRNGQKRGPVQVGYLSRGRIGQVLFQIVNV